MAVALLDLVMAYVEDPQSPGIQEKLRELQQELEEERRGLCTGTREGAGFSPLGKVRQGPRQC